MGATVGNKVGAKDVGVNVGPKEGAMVGAIDGTKVGESEVGWFVGN